MTKALRSGGSNVLCDHWGVQGHVKKLQDILGGRGCFLRGGSWLRGCKGWGPSSVKKTRRG